MPRGAAGAERGLEFVRAEGELGVNPQIHQHRQVDQAAAAGDRIHKSGHETRPEKQRQVPGLNHGAKLMPVRAGLKQKAGVNSNVFLRELRELTRIILGRDAPPGRPKH